MDAKPIIIVAVVIAVLAGAAFYPTSTTQTTVGSSSSTTATSCTTVTPSSSTTTSASTSSSASSTTTTSTTSTSTVTNGSFSYSPTAPVRVDSVTATTSTGTDGNTRVTFQVQFENTGTAPVYILGGCGSGLSSSIASGASVLRQVNGGPLCDCAEVILPLYQGQNHNSTNPGCWSGFSYELVGQGMVDMNFTLRWSSSGQGLPNSNSTSIQAQFNF